MASKAFLQQAYLAYFGRPADPSGLAYYAEKTEAQVKAAFSASPESQAFFGSMAVAAQINTIYQNLFNRDAEPAGLAYWSQEIGSGRLSLADAAMGILAGAQNDDKTAVTNKLAASDAFTAKLDTTAEILGYAGSAAISPARAYLKAVDATAASLTTATTGVDASVASVVAAGSGSTNVGQTFTLTTGLDNVNGTAGNDNIIGTFDGTAGVIASTLNAGDQINGGAGSDSLKVVVSNVAAAAGSTSPLAGVTVSNVEKVTVQNAAANDVAVNAQTLAGVTTFESLNSTGIVGVTNLATGSKFSVSGAGTTANAAFTMLNASDAVNVTVDGGVNGVTIQSGAVVAATELLGAASGTATSATINSTGAANGNVAVGANTFILTGGTNTLTSLAVNAATNLRATLTAADFAAAGAALTVSGAATAVNLGTNGVYKTVDASSLEGGLTVGLNAVTTSFKGGKGDDSVSAAANTITTSAVIDAGTGTDTIGALAVNAGNAAAFKNFEQVDLAGFAAAAADNFDVALLTGSTITGAVISGTYGGGVGANTATLSNIAEPATGFNVIVTEAANGNALSTATLAFAPATVSGTSDALNVKFQAADQAAAATSSAGTLTAARVENINIESKGGLNVSNSIGLTVNDAKAITITGDKALTLTVTGQAAGVASTTASQLTSIDGSAATGNLTITTASVNAAISQAAMTIKGGSGNDVITAVTSATGTNTGASPSAGMTVTTGAGNDTVNVSGASARAGTSFQSTTITDFQKGDSIIFAAKGVEVFNATAAVVSTASTLTEAVNIAVAGDGSTNGIINWFVYGGNTYIVEDVSAGATWATGDVIVKLTGVLDLSTSTYSAGAGGVVPTVTFA